MLAHCGAPIGLANGYEKINMLGANMAKNRFLGLFVALCALTIFSSLAFGFGDPPAVGVAAPDFKLPTTEGGPVSLSQYKGKWVVLYFYPRDMTSGCTLEAHNFQADLAKYQASNAVILGVSVDTAESHKSFCAKEGLNFKLLADVGAKVSTEYGSVVDYQGN